MKLIGSDEIFFPPTAGQARVSEGETREGRIVRSVETVFLPISEGGESKTTEIVEGLACISSQLLTAVAFHDTIFR